jgi:hypothetical protein
MALSYFDKFVGFHQLWVADGRKVLHAVASFGQGAIQNLTTIGGRVFFSVKARRMALSCGRRMAPLPAL